MKCPSCGSRVGYTGIRIEKHLTFYSSDLEYEDAEFQSVERESSTAECIGCSKHFRWKTLMDIKERASRGGGL